MRLVRVLLIFLVVIGVVFIAERVLKTKKNSGLLTERSQVRLLYNVLNHTNSCSNCSLWPSKQKTDTAFFSNSADFFNYLIVSEHSEYYDMNNLREIFFDVKGTCKWSILINVSDKLADDIPVIVSSRIDLQKLMSFMISPPLKKGMLDLDFGEGVIQQKSFKHYGCVLIRPEFFKSYNPEKYNPLRGDRLNWPSKLYYLTPTGMVQVVINEAGGSKKMEKL